MVEDKYPVILCNFYILHGLNSTLRYDLEKVSNAYGLDMVLLMSMRNHDKTFTQLSTMHLSVDKSPLILNRSTGSDE
jgi:hypothetical protein